MKNLFSFIAGLIAGLFVGWRLKMRQYTEVAETLGTEPDYDNATLPFTAKYLTERVKPCQKQEEAHTSLADTPITWKSEDGSRFTIWDGKNGIRIVSLGYIVVIPCAKNHVKIESEEE
jgi:hypothetical protein